MIIIIVITITTSIVATIFIIVIIDIRTINVVDGSGDNHGAGDRADYAG